MYKCQSEEKNFIFFLVDGRGWNKRIRKFRVRFKFKYILILSELNLNFGVKSWKRIILIFNEIVPPLHPYLNNRDKKGSISPFLHRFLYLSLSNTKEKVQKGFSSPSQITMAKMCVEKEENLIP